MMFTLLRLPKVTRTAALLPAALAAAVLWSAGAWAAVTAEPAAVTFNAPDQSATVQLRQEGKPVAAAEVQGYDLLVGDHTYEYMISLTKQEGSVLLKPTDQMEVGSYQLVIRTAHGPVTVAVYSPLAEVSSILDEQALALGIPVAELKARLGLAVPVRGGEKVTFALAPVYYVGDKLKIATPCPADRTYEWLLNGKVVATGTGTAAAPMEYTFTATGLHVLEYNEKLNNRVVASGRETANVVAAAPAMKLEAVSPSAAE